MTLSLILLTAAVVLISITVGNIKTQKLFPIIGIFSALLILTELALMLFSIRLTPSIKYPASLILAIVLLSSICLATFSKNRAIIAVLVSVFLLMGYIVLAPAVVKYDLNNEHYVGTLDKILPKTNTKIDYYRVLNPIFISAKDGFRADYGIILGSWESVPTTDPKSIEYFE